MTVCPNCQSENPDGSAFCNRCGQPLADTETVDEAPESASRVSFGLIALAVMSVLLVIVGILLFNWQRGRRASTADNGMVRNRVPHGHRSGESLPGLLLQPGRSSSTLAD